VNAHGLLLSGLVIVSFALAGGEALATGEDQLYTGTAITTPPGHFQVNTYYMTTYESGFTASGQNAEFGLTKNADARIGYGYLWSRRTPGLRLGPSLGAKWRFEGNGRTNASTAVSALCAFNQSPRSNSNTPDVGLLLIVQRPTRQATLLLNIGNAWTGEKSPNVRYLAVAAARKTSNYALAALEYVDIDTWGNGDLPGGKGTLIAGFVYTTTRRPLNTLSLQTGRTIRNGSGWNTTLGVSLYF